MQLLLYYQLYMDMVTCVNMVAELGCVNWVADYTTRY